MAKMNSLKTLVGWLLAIAVAHACLSAAREAPLEDGDGSHQIAPHTSEHRHAIRPNFKASKLLDFASFKKLFHKHYHSPGEESNRKRHFLARSVRAFVTSIKYKLRKASCFMAINEMSDWTPEELDATRNKAIEAAESTLNELQATTKRIVWFELFEQPVQAERELLAPIYHKDLKLPWAERQKLPNVNFVDHRRSSCMGEPRRQGACGSCYAFAMMTMMEWHRCTKSFWKSVEPLSEQYMIDCGRSYDGERLQGCKGGFVSGVVEFVQESGLEPLSSYPYRGRARSCPLKRRPLGKIRVDLSDSTIVHQDHFERLLRHGPIWVQLRSAKYFQEYGGGIDDGHKCGPEPNHAMVLVGHGREDGEHYWILRNSFGVKWGEFGYYRLARRRTAQCLYEAGFVFGTNDGVNYK